jgi:glycosyltransferase involved in cell wall biosynthesis
LVIAASSYLATEAAALGARNVQVIPFGVDIPVEVGPPADPPHVLFAGRLSEEKGVLEFVEATQGVPRVIVGDGPLRAKVPETVGFVPPDELGGYYERAAVVCVPSRREGYGFSAREAMAYGRPVVASKVGGLLDLGRGAILVPPGDPDELGAAIRSLLADPDTRLSLGASARSAARSSAETAVELAETYRRTQISTPPAE